MAGGTRLLLPPPPRTHTLSWAAHSPAAAGFLSLPPLFGPLRLSNLIFPAGEAALGASVAVPPPRPAGATAAGRCPVPKRSFLPGKSQEKAKTRGKKRKRKKTCRHTNKAKVRVNKNQAVGKSSRRRVSASWGWSFHRHGAREPRRAGGAAAPLPAAGGRAAQGCQLRAQAGPAPAASAPRGQGASHFNGGETATASSFLSPPRSAAAGSSSLPPAAANAGSAPAPRPLLRLTDGTTARTTSGPTRG